MDNTKLLQNTTKYRKTKKGMITNLYHKMKERNTVSFDLNFIHEFANCIKFNRLFSEWEKSNYNKQFKPSIDRIDHKKPYEKNNIQWLTWAENRFKQSMERRKRGPGVAQLINGKIIKVFTSQREAVRKTGLLQSGLSSALNGRYKYCGGYEWEYIHDNKDLLK